jgi:hypothetical protein
MHTNLKYWLQLVEGRDAPLYHATDLASAELILRSDKLEARTDQRVGNKTVWGVSLTRTPNFTDMWAKVKYGKDATIASFVLDQRKIVQSNKIVPLDWFQTYDPAIVRMELDGKAFGDIPYQRRQFPHMKDEEFVLGDIRNLKRKLLRIILSKRAAAIVQDNPAEYPQITQFQ